MKRRILPSLFFLWMGYGLVFSQSTEEKSSVEKALLNHLNGQLKKHGDQAFWQGFHLPLRPERLQIIRQYRDSLPTEAAFFSILKGFSAMESSPWVAKLAARLPQKMVPITPKALIAYVETQIRSGFRVQNGDLVLTLPHSEKYYRQAMMNGDFYAFMGVVWISDSGDPRVFMMDSEQDLVDVPLGDGLLGIREPNDRFVLLRYDGIMDKEEMSYALSLVKRCQQNFYNDSEKIMNSPIEDPELYFQKSCFVYPEEFAFLLYEYVLKNSSFVADPAVVLSKLPKEVNGGGTAKPTAWRESLVFSDRKGILCPNCFSLSPRFQKVMEWGDETELSS